MNFRCPSCGLEIPHDTVVQGTFHTCANCGHKFRLPRLASSAFPAASPSGLRTRRIAAELIILLLLVLPWLGRLFEEPPQTLLFLGRFHPLIVHLPIGALILAFLMELFAVFPRYRILREAAGFVLWVGTFTAVIAVVAGLFLSFDGYDGELVTRHMYLGLGTAIAAVLACLWKGIHGVRNSLRSGLLYGALLIATVTLLGAAGHLGGTLTHGAGYLTHYMPPALSGLLDPDPPPAQPTIYADLVHPIFQARCATCHGETKQKGDYRMEPFEALLAGGKTPPAIVPGTLKQGELIYRITLPPDDLDAMPPEGRKPLTEEEVALISWWIESGASAEASLGDVDVPASIQQILDARVSPEEQQRRKAEAAARQAGQADLVARLQEELDAHILPLAQDAPELQFSCAGSPAAIGDAELERLAPVAGSLVWLDLAGTSVGDRGLAHVAAMHQLKRLSLQNTAVTGDGLSHLAGLDQLEYLNLYGTAIDDTGLQHLAGLSSLQNLYVWQTHASDTGIADLQKALPHLEINRGENPGSPGGVALPPDP